MAIVEAIEDDEVQVVETPETPKEQPGFFDLLIKSIFEPGVNSAVVICMNVSFFLLILTLIGLAYITDWNLHVIFLLCSSTVLWFAMIYFVMQVTAAQSNPETQAAADSQATGDAATPADESRKTR